MTTTYQLDFIFHPWYNVGAWKGDDAMLYAAYGSNLNLEQMAYRCPKSKPVGKAVIKDWELVFNLHADIVEQPDAEVPVLLWDIADADWRALDMYEGYPEYYVREKVLAIRDDGSEEEVIAYVMAKGKKDICPPQMYYFKTCLKGYDDNDMNPRPLYDALIESLEVEELYAPYV